MQRRAVCLAAMKKRTRLIRLLVGPAVAMLLVGCPDQFTVTGLNGAPAESALQRCSASAREGGIVDISCPEVDLSVARDRARTGSDPVMLNELVAAVGQSFGGDVSSEALTIGNNHAARAWTAKMPDGKPGHWGVVSLVRDQRGVTDSIVCFRQCDPVDRARCIHLIEVLAAGGLPGRFRRVSPGQPATLARKQIQVASGVEVLGPRRLRSSQGQVSWRAARCQPAEVLLQDALKAISSDAAAELQKVVTTPAACVIGGADVTCQRATVDLTGLAVRFVYGLAPVDGTRTFALCSWNDTGSPALPVVCEAIIRLR